jgi:hypothetical protein
VMHLRVRRVLDPAERQDLDKKRRSKKNEGTMKQYSNKHGVWEVGSTLAHTTIAAAVHSETVTPAVWLI